MQRQPWRSDVKRLRGFILQLCFVASIGAAASAQDTYNNDLGLLLGLENIPSRGTAAGVAVDFSKSVVFSASYARRLAGEDTALYLEFPFAAAPSHSVESSATSIITDLATLFITPSLRLQFANRGPISPWISGGFGYGQYEGSARLAGGVPNPDERQHVGTAQFGGGVDIRTPIRILVPIGFRAEVRDYYTPTAPSFAVPVRDGGQHNIVVAGGLVIRF